MGRFSKWCDRPDLALDDMFSEAEGDRYKAGAIFISTGLYDAEVNTRYGSFKYVTRKDLLGREFIVDWCDYRPGIIWLDQYHSPYEKIKNKCITELSDEQLSIFKLGVERIKIEYQHRLTRYRSSMDNPNIVW